LAYRLLLSVADVVVTDRVCFLYILASKKFYALLEEEFDMDTHDD